MTRWTSILSSGLASGTVASATSTLALALLARAEGKGALQPVNSTSHWLHGERAALVTRADLAHTGVGYATHHAATVFWAVLFEWWTGRRRGGAALPLLQDALAVSALAAMVDYTVTPRRFTPGWEFVVSKRAIAGAYVAMAAGMAAGAMWRRR